MPISLSRCKCNSIEILENSPIACLKKRVVKKDTLNVLLALSSPFP